MIQRQECPDESHILKQSSKKNVKISSPLARVNPIIDEHGLLRVGSRLENAPLDHDAKFPLILPKGHYVS